MTQSIRSKTKPKPSSLTDAWEFEAIGTHWWIGVYEPVSPSALIKLQQSVNDRIESFDQTYSRFRADSWVSQVAKPGTYDLPADAYPLFSLYRALYTATDGLVTPLIGNVLSDAGYDASYSLVPKNLTAAPRWEDAIEVTETSLRVLQPILFDFGAAGKGYLVDIVSDLLRAASISAFCVDAGGDIRVSNVEGGLRVGLENPDDASQVLGVYSTSNGSICGSAGNRRAWAQYHHIMNPYSLAPANEVKAVWVAADSGMLTDGLTTALSFVDPDQLRREFQFDYFILYADNSFERSDTFSAEIYIDQPHA